MRGLIRNIKIDGTPWTITQSMEGQAYYPVLNMKGELQDPSLADLKERIKRFGASNAVTRDGASQNGVGVGYAQRT